MKALAFVLAVLSVGELFGQQQDSIDSVDDGDTAEFYTGTHYEGAGYTAPTDTTVLTARSFNPETVKSLKADPDLNYQVPPTAAENLFARFWSWVNQMIEGFFSSMRGTNIGTLLLYGLGLVLLVAIVLMILKVNAFKVLYFGQDVQKYQLFDEDIHEMDFDRLIQQAIDGSDYRRGIRLIFLYALRLLSDRQLITWNTGKTNHEYVRELRQSALKDGFNDLSYYFDYAWYGNFVINQQLFQQAYRTFSEWRTKLDG